MNLNFDLKSVTVVICAWITDNFVIFRSFYNRFDFKGHHLVGFDLKYPSYTIRDPTNKKIEDVSSKVWSSENDNDCLYKLDYTFYTF